MLDKVKSCMVRSNKAAEWKVVKLLKSPDITLHLSKAIGLEGSAHSMLYAALPICNDNRGIAFLHSVRHSHDAKACGSDQFLGKAMLTSNLNCPSLLNCKVLGQLTRPACMHVVMPHITHHTQAQHEANDATDIVA